MEKWTTPQQIALINGVNRRIREVVEHSEHARSGNHWAFMAGYMMQVRLGSTEQNPTPFPPMSLQAQLWIEGSITAREHMKKAAEERPLREVAKEP